MERQCSLTPVDKTRSWKLTRLDSDGAIEEVVLRVQGIICSKFLPPIVGPLTMCVSFLLFENLCHIHACI